MCDDDEHQRTAIEAFCASRAHIVLNAPPGTGKSWTLVEAGKMFCARHGPDARLLLLAYNTELSGELTALIDKVDLTHQIECCTMHALCSRCIGPAPDDAALLACILSADADPSACRGLHVDALLVDEAQDVNELHVRLMEHVIRPADAGRPPMLFVAGDSRQRLYDFGSYPSILGTMESPSCIFGRIAQKEVPWQAVWLTRSRRLSPRMACIVDGAFQTALRSSRVLSPAEDSATVRVHACGKWDIGSAVSRILRDHAHVPLSEICLLAASKAGNMPLLAAMNDLSVQGVALHVHGVDGADSVLRSRKMRVMSFHASKGIEVSVCIVLATADAKNNPLYVALTRARSVLHIVFVMDDAHAELAAATRAVLGSSLVPSLGKPAVQRQRETASCELPLVDVASLDNPRNHEAAIHMCTARVLHSGHEELVAKHAHMGSEARFEDTADVYGLAVRCCLEFAVTRRVRAMQDCLTPCRMEHARRVAAMRSGHMGRFVSPWARDDRLLPYELKLLASEALERIASAHVHADHAESWCTVASALLSWNGYHHRMRQLLPVSAWVDEEFFARTVHRMRSSVPHVQDVGACFDTRLTRERHGIFLHARAHVVTRDGVWHIVSSSATSDFTTSQRCEAFGRALLHESGACTLLSLRSGRMERIVASDVSLEDLLQLVSTRS